MRGQKVLVNQAAKSSQALVDALGFNCPTVILQRVALSSEATSSNADSVPASNKQSSSDPNPRIPSSQPEPAMGVREQMLRTWKARKELERQRRLSESDASSTAEQQDGNETEGSDQQREQTPNLWGFAYSLMSLSFQHIPIPNIPSAKSWSEAVRTPCCLVIWNDTTSMQRQWPICRDSRTCPFTGQCCDLFRPQSRRDVSSR